jgi:hypothetical protein
MSFRPLVLVLVLAAIAAVAFAAAGSASPSSTTLSFSDAQLSFTLSPQGPPGVGSRLLLTKALFNRAPQFGKPIGARVGSAEVVCTVVSQQRAQCSVTAHVPNGEIVAMGAMTITRNGLSRNTFAIVGGAGAYAHASGTIASRDVSQTKSLVELHLA